jgi:beta-phosphoglucomutase-like phosphatase (HAD superfamily)
MADSTPVEEIAPKALLLELEFGCLEGARELVFKAMEKALKERGAKLTRGLFCEFALAADPALALTRLGEKLEVSFEDEELDAFDAELTKAFEKAPLVDGVEALLKAARAADLPIGMLSIQSEEAATASAARFGEVNVVVTVGASNRLRQRVWRQLARELETKTRFCTTVASGGGAAKSALAAGLRCVAVPDTYTGFEDLGGTDYVFDALDKESITKILALIESY